MKERLKKLKDPKKAIGRFYKAIGPGFVTGASYDDPSGVATYSIAGAQLGSITIMDGMGNMAFNVCSANEPGNF